MSVLAKRLLIVVEAALARFVIALAALRCRIAPPLRPRQLGPAAGAAASAGLTRDGFTNRNRPAVEQRSIHGLHRCRTLVIGFHLEKGEAAAAACFAIHDHFRRGDGAELGESFL